MTTDSDREYVFGYHTVEGKLKLTPGDVLEVWFDATRKDNRAQHLQQMVTELGLPLIEKTKKQISQIVGKGNHQGIVAWIKPMPLKPEAALYSLLDDLTAPALLLVLDQVTDPHNLGACLRAADGAGVHALIVPKDGSCSVNETVRRVASGAAEQVPVFYVSNLVRTLEALKQRNVWLTGLSDKADQDIYQADLTGNTALVMGSEGAGMRRLTTESCDHLVAIPMAGAVSSLNVAVATGVTLFEAVRQRSKL